MKIEKGVPIPPKGNQGVYQYPWHELEVGDCITLEDRRQFLDARNSANAYKYMQRRHGKDWHFVSRIKELRIWRTE